MIYSESWKVFFKNHFTLCVFFSLPVVQLLKIYSQVITLLINCLYQQETRNMFPSVPQIPILYEKKC